MISATEQPKIMKGYYQIHSTEDGRFRFNLHAGNHEIILTSQLYGDRGSAENGIASVRENGSHPARFERKMSAKGEPYFLLKAANGQIIGTSEMYGTEASRDNGVQSVMKQCPSEVVKEA